MLDVKAIQDELKKLKLDGWLFFDHHHRDPIAAKILQLGWPRGAGSTSFRAKASR
jgi:hypothetical protein